MGYHQCFNILGITAFLGPFLAYSFIVAEVLKQMSYQSDSFIVKHHEKKNEREREDSRGDSVLECVFVVLLVVIKLI